MIVRLAREQDIPAFLELAAQVEHWFGPMVEDPGFHGAVLNNIRRGTALVAASGPNVVGGLLFGVRRAPIYHVRWLVVSEPERGVGVGRALISDAVRRFVRAPATIEVITFGLGHPAATGARAFYESLGFTPAEAAAPGPEGGPRQVFRRIVSA
ncbi:GNAT family N-acetyltransferase [Nocardia sp. NBC_00565]|uniref:GNAT family N-acetyltransferase n=1 Tax=Nocardia sp. NBC_00565 TaxID=2975993 RepID=UPI002E81EC3C|nr:GNAT family N-acetyltransferase [Nocardia sp. NBC_00565]WUC06230.1 GNAT family N-acetyltransferase [Nocardia sp. NBC_00565]